MPDSAIYLLGEPPQKYEFITCSAELVQALPFYACAVSTGFPSPADDHLRSSLDLNEYLIRHPAATFYTRGAGRSMEPLIFDGDLMMIDRAEKPGHDKVILAILNGDFTCKRLYQKDGVVRLVPENPEFPSITITEDIDFEVWGVLACVIRQVR